MKDQAPRAADDMDSSAQDMKRLTADLNNPAEWEEGDAALAEADRQDKQLVRKEMVTADLQEEFDAWDRASAGIIEKVELLAEEIETNEKR